MKIYLKKSKSAAERFTIPASVARLRDDQFKKLGFEAPMKRLMKELVKRHHGAIGIEFLGVEFCWMLEPEERT